MIFRPPYPLLFTPPADQAGVNTVIPRNSLPIGMRGYSIAGGSGRTGSPSDHDPSACHILLSQGVLIVTPTDTGGRLFVDPRVPVDIQVFARLNITGLFDVGGFVASALSAGWVKVFLEEFNSGAFVRGMAGQHLFIKDDTSTLIGVGDFPTSRSTATHTAPSFISWTFPGMNPTHRYRIWVDVEGHIQSAGFGFLGVGSEATANLAVTVSLISVEFVLSTIPAH